MAKSDPNAPLIHLSLFDAMPEGFALHEILCDAAGKPSDYRFLFVNRAFETITGLRAGDLVGRTAHEVLPHPESLRIEEYGRVALTGRLARFEIHSQPLGQFFQVSVFCPECGQFATLLTGLPGIASPPRRYAPPPSAPSEALASAPATASAAVTATLATGSAPAIPPSPHAGSPEPSVADSPPTPQAFDEPDLLNRLRGNESLADRVLRLYLTDSEHLLQRAGQSLASGNLTELSVVAHTLKGSSLNVGAQCVARAAATLENLAKSVAGDPPKLTLVLDALRSALAEAHTPIEARLRRGG